MKVLILLTALCLATVHAGYYSKYYSGSSSLYPSYSYRSSYYYPRSTYRSSYYYPSSSYRSSYHYPSYYRRSYYPRTSMRYLRLIWLLLIIQFMPWLYELSRFFQNYIDFAFVRD